MTDQRDHLRDQIREALVDERTQRLRVSACRAISAALSASGRSLWTGSHIVKNNEAESVALLTEMTAELSQGIVELFSQEYWYAGSSLLRQLIETEYLFWLFAYENNAAEAWIKSTPDEIRRQFSQSSIRRRSSGKFRDSEYWHHCDLGGHPNPKGRLLLRDHTNPIGSQMWLWIDFVKHLQRLWSSFHQCLLKHQLHEFVDSTALASADQAINRWLEQESPALQSLSIPDTD